MASSFWKMGFTPAGYNKGNKKEIGYANAATDLRSQTSLKAAARAQELRDRNTRLYQPMERGLSEEFMAGYAPDNAQISAQAMTDVGDSFARSGEDYAMRAARRGLSPDMFNDPEIIKQRTMDETSAKIFASNTANNQARDRSEVMTAQRGAQITALGAQRPYLASGETLAGDSALADLEDYDAQRQQRANADFAATDTGMAAGSSWKHGGTVTNPMRKGLKPPIEGKARRMYADGGSVGDTMRLKNKHTEAYSAGETDKQFGEWLQENGYELSGDNMASPKTANKPAQATKVDYRPRTPDFLFQPRNTKPPKNFADGGLIEEPPVELETNDYIMPEDVVSTLGRKYFDDLVAGGGK